MDVPLLDLNQRSHDAIQQMGGTAANEMASRPPSAEVAAASKAGNSIPATTGVVATESNDRPAIEGMAQPKVSFDYTHLGRQGADYFAAMVVEELALKVPELRPLLIP